MRRHASNETILVFKTKLAALYHLIVTKSRPEIAVKISRIISVATSVLDTPRSVTAGRRDWRASSRTWTTTAACPGQSTGSSATETRRVTVTVRTGRS